MVEGGHAQQKARIRRRRRRMLRVEKGIFRGRFLCKHIHELKKHVKRSLLWGPTTPDTPMRKAVTPQITTLSLFSGEERPLMCVILETPLKALLPDCALLTTLEHFLFSMRRV